MVSRARRPRPLPGSGPWWLRAWLVALLGALAACGAPEDTERAANPSVNAELYQEEVDALGPLADADEARVIADFTRLWLKRKPIFHNKFLGVVALQNPLDVWITQEIIVEVEPDFIVETGTYQGGSAALWAVLLEQVNPQGRVITIDIEDQRSRRSKALPITQQKVDFLLGGSADPKIVAEVARRVQGKKVLVILDSLHTREHVAAELAAYAPLVSPGSYLIVQDMLPGVRAAVDEFLAADDRFVADVARERFGLTNSAGGFLRRR